MVAISSENPSRVDDSEGAQSAVMPVVEWAYTTIGQPPWGAVPAGTKTVPVTSVSSPVMPDFEVYAICAASDVSDFKRLSIVGSDVAENSAPGDCPAPVVSGFRSIPDELLTELLGAGAG